MNDARISVRLSASQREEVEAAASNLGQSVEEFVASTLLREARQTLRESCTRLSDRDRNTLLAVLDDENVEPNEALKSAAISYKEWFERPPSTRD